MAQLLKTHEDCAFSLTWTERGIVSGGVDGCLRITHAQAAIGGDKATKAGPPQQDVIHKAHTSGVHAVAGDRDGQSAYMRGACHVRTEPAPAPAPPQKSSPSVSMATWLSGTQSDAR